MLSPDSVDASGFRLGASAVLVALALVLATLVVVEHRADAAPSVAPTAALVAGVAPVAAVVAAPLGAVAPQIDIRQFVCPILLAVRNAFRGSPFFAFVASILDSLLRSFGCAVS